MAGTAYISQLFISLLNLLVIFRVSCTIAQTFPIKASCPKIPIAAKGHKRMHHYLQSIAKMNRNQELESDMAGSGNQQSTSESISNAFHSGVEKIKGMAGKCQDEAKDLTGDAGGWPSTTGNPSGGNRSNNSPIK